MKVAIYARVSTNDQSADSQLVALREFAKARGYEIVEEFVDIGISGSKSSRPELDRMMKMMRSRKFKGIKAVMVFRFDRFARSSKHLAMALEEFKDFGIQFISYSENVDTTTSIGQAMFTIISAMAQLERDIIRERVMSGLNSAKAKGKKLGRPKTVRSEMVVPLRNLGWSYSRIGKELGISTASVSRALKDLP